MPRPQLHEDTRDRLDDAVDDSVGVRPDYLTFNQKVEMVLDELETKEEEVTVQKRQIEKLDRR